MSTANLNVWITKIGDPCHITDATYFVTIVDCGGKVLEWCGKTYSFLPARCGHLEIEIPPGCYVVFAGQDPKGIGVPPFGNLLTHIEVVRANCGDHVCVTLFAPTLHYCGTWFTTAIQTIIAGGGFPGVDPKLAPAALQAVQALLAKVPADTFTANTVEALAQGPPKQ
jgi:hypothetical protein